MNRDQQLKTLKSPKASKEQLREALAASLGVVYERQTKEREITIFTQCRDSFLEAYKKHTGIAYSFEAMDGRALSSIIKKIGNLENTQNDVELLDSFNVLIYRLPDWYKQNAFSLVIINNKFNEIIASIRKNGNGQQPADDSLESKLAQRANARRFNA